MKEIKFKVLRKNKYGHRFILEPKERIKFREKCKYNEGYSSCKKNYKCYVDHGVLLGCTSNVDCPRCHNWDKRHGLELPYTMVENEYPYLKQTTFTWHPATESPGMRRIIIAFRVKGHENDHLIFNVVRFLERGAQPATVKFTADDGTKQLPVAWAYYDEFVKGIEEWMIKRATYAAWGWWPDDK